MLHRDTFDRLSDIGTVLTWELSEKLGGYIVVWDNESTFTVWHESWEGDLTELDSLVLIGSPHEIDTFALAQDLAKGHLRKVLTPA